MSKVFESITERWVRSNIISNEDKQLYKYGLEQGAIYLSFAFVVLVLGLVFNQLLATIVFLLAYVVLRAQAGGFHADTKMTCFVLSVFSVVIALIAMRVLANDASVILIPAAICGVCLLFLAPVETKNKPLDEMEVAVYGRRTRYVLIAEWLILIGTFLIGWKMISMAIMLAIVQVAIGVAAGVLANNH